MRMALFSLFQCMLCEDEDVWYPPMEVEKDEYETLLEFLASCGFEDEALFVDRYYKEDKNGPTSYYHLQVDLQQSGIFKTKLLRLYLTTIKLMLLLYLISFDTLRIIYK